MASYNVLILPVVIKKDLPKIPKNDVRKIMSRIESLGENPRPDWSKKLSGREEYRARSGNYRILYVIDDGIKIVQVTKVRDRKKVYK
ncbi:MAG: type II toxin-antitoxin system RelE/ParE family toxin [Candidatus Saccharibacteria bacterium]|nr:type II toxin-antitoxin system RelE/ParE family toxin [Candidatus Saccharibacteria bacterium]